MITGHPANSGTNVDVNPARFVQTNAGLNADVVALSYPGGDLTFAQLNDKAARFATVLTDSGVQAGDRVAYLGLNSPSYIVTMLGAFRIGAIFVPVNFRLAGPELSEILRQSGAVLIVCEENHRPALDEVVADTPLRRCLLVDDDSEVPAPESGLPDRWEPWSSLLAAAEPAGAPVRTTFDDVAILLFTSGTTGLPKGVILTYGNCFWNSINEEMRIDSRLDDVTYGAAPMFHIAGLNVYVLRSLARSGTVLLRRTFDPVQMLDDIVNRNVTTTFGVPAMFQALARVPGVWDADLSKLRGLICAGAPVPPSLIEEYASHGVLLEQAWGLTETAPFATHLPAAWTQQKLGSAGVPMPFTEVRVVDATTNEPVPAGVAGELVVRGPNVTPGYWENPEATAAAFDDEGWFHSGDVGYLDEDGCLFIVDRLKDMIISGGENVYPAEVERALADLHGVLDVAVVGAADAKWGEAVVAVVQMSPESGITLQEVRDHAARKLARYKLPSRLQIVGAVPRNASGKLDKVMIRQMVAEGDS